MIDEVYKKIKKKPKFIGTKNGNMLSVNFLENEIILWPFSGHSSIEISVNNNGNFFQGIVEGFIEYYDDDDDQSKKKKEGKNKKLNENKNKIILRIPLKIELIKTPLRRDRILFDQYHNIQYPVRRRRR